jgi:outer membrane protein assembly factor BamA
MAGTRQPVFASGRGRGERRPWRLLLALALALGPAAALGQEDAPEEGLVAEDLDTLMAIPLPGEAAVAPEPVDRDAVDRLMGRTIVRVTTSDSAPGFDPVQDANIPLGLELSRALVRKAVYRLWETGRYRDVTIRVRPVQAHEVELVVGVEPMLRVGRIRIKGNSALDDEDVAKAMGYTPGQTILPDPEVLRGLKGKLLAVYASKGYREARASLSIVTTEDPGTVDLVGEITEGEPERYDVIEIPGLPESVNSEAVLKKGTVRDHALIDGATGKLRTLLAKAGYLDAEILPFEERRIDRYRMALRIPLKVKFPTEFHIEGNRHFLATHLLEIVDGEGAMGTTPESVSRRLRSLKKYYREHGFFFVDIEVLRRCFARRDTARIMRIDGQCRPGTARQEIIIIVREGPDVEVDEILSLGNRWFTDEDIQEELFAFVAEKNAPKSVFQPVAPATLDELGISDKRPDGNGSTRGIDAPRTQRARVYVPEQYAQAMAHLVGVYQEQGFLSAAVRDTCLIKSRRAITRNGERFVPLVISRDSEGGEEPGHKDLAPCVYVNGERDRLLVVIHVDEGVQTTVQEIAFDGNQVLSSMA